MKKINIIKGVAGIGILGGIAVPLSTTLTSCGGKSEYLYEFNNLSEIDSYLNEHKVDAKSDCNFQTPMYADQTRYEFVKRNVNFDFFVNSLLYGFFVNGGFSYNNLTLKIHDSIALLTANVNISGSYVYKSVQIEYRDNVCFFTDVYGEWHVFDFNAPFELDKSIDPDPNAHWVNGWQNEAYHNNARNLTFENKGEHVTIQLSSHDWKNRNIQWRIQPL